MPSEIEPAPRFSLKGKLGLIVAVAVVVILLVALPAYRIFFAISVAIGVVVAGILYLWNKYRPVKEAEEENKKPLGL
jgi:cytosine/uracil/thiamine/allantoin permease